LLFFRRASAATRHFIWFVMVCSVLLMPLFSAVLPAWRVLPCWMARANNRPALNDPIRFQASPINVKETVVIPLGHNPSDERTKSAVSQESPLRANPGARSEPATPSIMAIRPETFFVFVWMIGTMFSLLVPFLGILSLRRLRMESFPLTELAWLRLLEETLNSLNLRRRVILLQSPRRRVVLLHELAHIKRWDYLTNLITRIGC